jgi:hypothetical protein
MIHVLTDLAREKIEQQAIARPRLSMYIQHGTLPEAQCQLKVPGAPLLKEDIETRA